MRSVLAVVLVHSLVVTQAHAPMGSVVVGPGYEGVIVAADVLGRSVPNGWPALPAAWAPTEADVREAEGQLADYLSSSEVAALVRGSRIRSELANYKRQYWGVVRDGRRELLLSFIHASTSVVASGQWRNTAILAHGDGDHVYPVSTGVVVNGGFDRFFRVSYGVESKRFSRLDINSPV